ncbi:LppX_LprAFG lipoprotein [Nocardioides panacisoli]|uniref:LppX_LprAFG lipoprotein n=1 Tax=Nocardioides panacisoli TaxID=627624 RepID=UPI001C630A9C|nr:LppX_LprAFG lipoprotein [Nocardioides panacisoli]QYJ05366.1 LppX_LprAFG lipoprotein [Nocardioides panacisoli]
MMLQRWTAGTVVGLVSVFGLSGCVGGGGDGGSSESGEDCAAPEAAMETAKGVLDDTSGAEFTLGTDDEVDGTGLVTADLTVVRPDAFRGDFTVQTPLGAGSGEAVGIGDTLWVKAPPLFTNWTTVDPSQFNLPDINGLLAADGLSTLLVGTEELSDGELQRDEGDASRTLCYYDGTVTAEQVGAVIPSAGGQDFTVEYAVDGDGALRKATVTGDVYDTGTELTYVLDVPAYDVEADIQPPV